MQGIGVACAHGGGLRWYVEAGGEHHRWLVLTVAGVSCIGKGD